MKTNLKTFYHRFIRLLVGLFAYALGIVFTLRANVGYAPWDVFHAGLSKTLGISFGTASIAVGLVILVIIMLLGEKLGLGTVLNIVLIGLVIDLILFTDIIPLCGGLISGVITLIFGLFVIAFASYLYIGTGFGAGPRDGLMVALTRKTGLPVGLCRGSVELSALCAGWLLGGMVGIGTVISAFAIGICVQLTFKLLKFDPATVEHETLKATYDSLFGRPAPANDENGADE